jgi:2-hydroxychromene-2-carboxylate isomerase
MSESTRSTPAGPAPFEFTAPLTVCVDVTHPLAYLAFGPVQATVAALGVAVDWLPFTAPPLKGPPDAGPRDDRGTHHRRARALYQAGEMDRYAAAQGLSLRDPFRAVAPLAAALGHLWLRRKAPQQVER